MLRKYRSFSGEALDKHEVGDKGWNKLSEKRMKHLKHLKHLKHYEIRKLKSEIRNPKDHAECFRNSDFGFRNSDFVIRISDFVIRI